MAAVAILLLVGGAFLVWCAVKGVNPLDTLKGVLSGTGS